MSDFPHNSRGASARLTDAPRELWVQLGVMGVMARVGEWGQHYGKGKSVAPALLHRGYIIRFMGMTSRSTLTG